LPSEAVFVPSARSRRRDSMAAAEFVVISGFLCRLVFAALCEKGGIVDGKKAYCLFTTRQAKGWRAIRIIPVQ
jgi:hypothetical protein